MNVSDHCLEISQFLKPNENGWSELFLWFAGQYELDQNATLTKIRHSFAGMGSFSDLVLYKNGNVDLEAMEKLGHLRDGLYDAVASEIIALRSQRQT